MLQNKHHLKNFRRAYDTIITFVTQTSFVETQQHLDLHLWEKFVDLVVNIKQFIMFLKNLEIVVKANKKSSTIVGKR